MKIDEKKGIVSLVKNDFTPLEESKEGLLKGGFGSVIPPGSGPTPFSMDNCSCNGNNCHCPDSGCLVSNASCRPSRRGNNCLCGTTRPPVTTTPPPPPVITSTSMMGFGF